MSVILIVSP